MDTCRQRFFYFGATRIDGSRDMRAQLGGKGADLAEMAALGLPVPPGFTISAQSCADFYALGKRLPDDLRAGLRQHIVMLEKETGKRFGGEDRPLLLSVRSGAAVSMPGMMDTILNLGLNDRVAAALARVTANRRFAMDAYRRLIDMYGGVVMGVPHAHFENALRRVKRKHGATHDTDLDERGLEEVVAAYKTVFRRYTGHPFPQNPETQLTGAIAAVFRSWESPRALEYRRIHAITGLPGTAVNVQGMVFGNMGGDSGTGVAFTRDPATGKNALYGEFLVNAQGEDVVAGIRTPRPVAEIKRWLPDLHAQLLAIKDKLEKHYLDMQDIEFTVERGKLWMLQTRTGKRTGAAAVRVAVNMVREKLIDERTALLRVAPADLNQLLLPSFDPKAKRVVLTRGLPASPGAACGRLAFSAEEAVARAARGEAVILVRRETSPEDIHGMHVAQGILTATGGTTSHAAVVARGWGKCCIAGALRTDIDERRKVVSINGQRYTTRDVFSLDGATGEVMLGELPRVAPKLSAEFGTLLRWADRHRRLGVRANADTPGDAARARAFGAEGVGLCRTEHMFFNPNRIQIMRQMIIAETEPARRRALRRLLPHQRRDFEEIFHVMRGLPVIIRLLDPPLHEFLPQDARAQSALARELRVPIARVRQRVSELHEANPMLGHRGCRVTITYPEVLEMQVTAITEAAIRCRRRGVAVRPEIMIPLVGIDRELIVLRAQVERAIAGVRRRLRFTGRLHIGIGTMIEVPRAALTADQIAKHADFFSFGTNDLTQMTLGYSRDDVNTFLPDYLRQGILDRSPFQGIDVAGVGQLVNMAVERGRAAKPDLECGICGEHGGDPASIAFFAAAGLDYVSCSPFRVPLARLAAAQSALRDH